MPALAGILVREEIYLVHASGITSKALTSLCFHDIFLKKLQR